MEGTLSSVTLPSVRARQKNLCKEKQKVPRKAVYKDTSNFGVRMLFKHGWEVGKGLGKQEDGMVNPISLRNKTDTKGVGFDGLKDDQWMQHHADFNDLLQRLNDEREQNIADGHEAPICQLQSLEERSKKSRSRVHYKKFTRGKDLSQANEKDLANIFGKRCLAEINKPFTMKDESMDGGEDGSVCNGQQTEVMGLTTIKSSLSMHDYFKEKMKQRRSSGAPGGDINNDADVAVELKPADEIKPKKKKKKHNAKSEKVPEETVTEIVSADDVEILPITGTRKRGVKKAAPVAIITETAAKTELTEPAKKKKKSKKQNSIVESADACESQDATQLNDELSLEHNTTEEPTKKKKKKIESNRSKKKKSSKNKISISDGDPENTVGEEQTAPQEEPVDQGIANKPAEVAEIISASNQVEDVTCRVKVEILKQLDETGFPGSNFCNIVGYRLTEDVKLIPKADSLNRKLAKHRFETKKFVSVQKKWQKLKKVSGFETI